MCCAHSTSHLTPPPPSFPRLTHGRCVCCATLFHLTRALKVIFTDGLFNVGPDDLATTAEVVTKAKALRIFAVGYGVSQFPLRGVCVWVCGCVCVCVVWILMYTTGPSAYRACLRLASVG